MRRTTKQEALFDLQAPQTLARRALGCLSVGCTDRMVHIICYERQRVKMLTTSEWRFGTCYLALDHLRIVSFAFFTRGSCHLTAIRTTETSFKLAIVAQISGKPRQIGRTSNGASSSGLRVTFSWHVTNQRERNKF